MVVRNDGLPVGISPNMTEDEARLLELMCIKQYVILQGEGENAVKRGNQQSIKEVSHSLDVWSRLVFRLHYFHPILLRPCELEEKIARMTEVIE